MRLVLGLRWVTTGRLGLLVDLVTLQQCRWGRQTWAVFSVMCRMPKWLKQWIIWNAPENRIQRGSKARLFDILWKMWWSSHVTINMQSLTGIHAPTIPYAWTTVVVHVASLVRRAGLLAWPGANLHMFTDFFHQASIDFSACVEIIWYLFWSILLGTSVPNCLANHNSSGNYHNTELSHLNQWCNFIRKFHPTGATAADHTSQWMDISDLRLRRFSSRRFP